MELSKDDSQLSDFLSQNLHNLRCFKLDNSDIAYVFKYEFLQLFRKRD